MNYKSATWFPSQSSLTCMIILFSTEAFVRTNKYLYMLTYHHCCDIYYKIKLKNRVFESIKDIYLL